jgi:hypothetical protein
MLRWVCIHQTGAFLSLLALLAAPCELALLM